ncbi:GntR family transcriptional regulator [Xinfangfangia sp. CPCC 101601]|uniref:GntR family transcriptional regulator n=1 Tax=Pseudogemmobacter lacusdianii TaxID=3069608 RepID=A0ABU0W263_9RHOB|nr:GntR family transcriptional regulator [Xinfangfangia sp. CPCC 101601]MDQ2068109.1 GntR family transcriptional regulator [Xinfangfangia sp. CPCC 101601]
MSSALQSIAPIARKETLGTMVREKLRAALMAGRFQPGEKLAIRAVAAALDVSLTPAREALYNLMAEGVLEANATGTIYVPELDTAKINELRRIRVSLECMAATEALQNLTDEDIKKILEINKAICEADHTREFSKLMELNWMFHFTIYEASKMPMLIRIIESCWLKMGSYLNVIYPYYGEDGKGIDLHDRVCAAIVARDALALNEAIAEDITQACDWMINRISAKT